MNTERLQNQEYLAAALDEKIKHDPTFDLMCEDDDLIAMNHEHICLYKMLNKPREAKRLCKKWIAEHPIQFPKYQDDLVIWENCDFCPHLITVVMDEEGKFICARRTFPDELRQIFDNRANS